VVRRLACRGAFVHCDLAAESFEEPFDLTHVLFEVLSVFVQQFATGDQCGRAVVCEFGVFLESLYRHSRCPHLIESLDPLQVRCGIAPMAGLVATDRRYETDVLVIAERVGAHA
jgi:hypothetical protein